MAKSSMRRARLVLRIPVILGVLAGTVAGTGVAAAIARPVSPSCAAAHSTLYETHLVSPAEYPELQRQVAAARVCERRKSEQH